MSRTLGFHFGEMIRPLIESTRVFVHVIAGTFAAYKLIPSDYPGLKDQFAPMSLTRVLWMAWRNLRFSKDNIVPILVFFSVLGILVFAGLFVVLFVLSLLSGQAHADGGFFDPASEQDAAQAWIEFLFNGGALPSFDAASTASSTWGFQAILSKALRYYSNAMLLIAAIVLFYHLVTMVVETAHSGVPMGKSSRQIWAPIRLVLAIGLLVPMSESGLNAGQYIVIKTAELGSGLASQVWGVFLDEAESPTANARMAAPMVAPNAIKLIGSLACSIDHDSRVQKAGTATDDDLILDDQYHPRRSINTIVDGLKGTLYYFGVGEIKTDILGQAATFVGMDVGQGGVSADSYLDVCGSLFIPSSSEWSGNWSEWSGIWYVSTDADNLARGAAEAQEEAINNNWIYFRTIGEKICELIPSGEAECGTADGEPIIIDDSVMTAIDRYQSDVISLLSAKLTKSDLSQTAEAAVKEMRPYGWAFAGSFLTSLQRVLSSTGDAISAGQPVVSGPKIAHMTSLSDGSAYKKVQEDMSIFMTLLQTMMTSGSTSSSSTSSTSVQCASMIGLTSDSEVSSSGWYNALPQTLSSLSQTVTNGVPDALINGVLWLVDWVATWNGVWSGGTGDTCSSDTAGDGLKTFKLGTMFSNGSDALSDLVNFGRANIQTGLRLVAWGAMIIIGGGIGSLAAGLLGSPVAGLAVGIGGGILGGILMFIATLFLALGFVFAFMLPLIMFTRFFFAVIIWIGEVCESVVAIPVVALAHLNPDGDGFLPDRAKNAYSFVFSIFLRPVMTIFGLIIGMLIFTIAANFLDYTYGIAIAASGATASGYEVLTKLAFTILYVYTMYI
ncbi:MAG: DotA/TraY family protein, partial [Alphaproteobacteria bacterium]|nr:DotA/TraY family protein [Alphaproteobacteria bacterium]